MLEKCPIFYCNFDDYFYGNVKASNIPLFIQKPSAEYVDVIWQHCL